MKVVIDAVGIRGHGGAAVLCELLHWLPIVRPDWFWHVFIFKRNLREFDDPVVSEKASLEHVALGDSGIGRLWWVNYVLPMRIKNLKADILFSVANIAPSNSTLPQIGLCHQLNAFSSEVSLTHSFFRQLRLRFMRWQILRGALASQGTIVQTKAMHDRIEHFEPRLKGRIHVIPSGYRTLTRNKDIRSQKRIAIDSASKPRLIYVSHPGDSKNHLGLIRAMPSILRKLPSATLLLTLEGQQPPNSHYKSYVDEIQGQANYLGVSDHLIFLGILNPDDVDYALRSSDLMVFPSLAESFGLGLVESMAAGCPIAAANIDYAHDVCGDAAVYFDPYDSENIAKTVVKILKDVYALEKLKTNANVCKIDFSYENIAEKIVLVLKSAMMKN